MGKKIKKFLKKAAKAAIIGGAIYGATRLAKNRKKKPVAKKYIGQDINTGKLQTGDATTAANIANWDRGMKRMAKINTEGRSGTQGGDEQTNVFKKDTTPDWAKGADTRGYGTTYKKGGRVTGCAKRGFGRALKRK